MHKPHTGVSQVMPSLTGWNLRCNALIALDKFSYHHYPQAL